MRWLVLFLTSVAFVGPAQAQRTAPIRLADGFDFPVGTPDADNYYKSRGYRPYGHLGEDWNGLGGGNTDLGDPVYNIGAGLVVFARDVRMGWGNVVIVRHAYSKAGRIHYIDSLYGHLDRILVGEGQQVRRRQLIGSIGNNRGMYSAHLHFEIRKNLSIGIERSSFSKGYENYHSPSRFIAGHRQLRNGGKRVRAVVGTFRQHAKFARPSPGRHPLKKNLVQETAARTRAAPSSGNESWRVNRYGDMQP